MPISYRVAVIGRTGKGNYGHGLDTAWLAFPQTKIVAVADDNKDGLTKAAQRLKVEHTFTDYRKMIDSVKPDIVAICPRWIDQHHEMSMYAAERGIHIFMEKPFCRTLEEADEIVRQTEQTHAKLAVAHPTRYSPKLPTLRKLLKQGAIGEVLEYRARGKEDSRGGGLDLWVLGSHMLDLLHALAGQPLSCMAQVRQNGKAVTKADVFEGAEGIGLLAGDELHATFEMKDGSKAYFASKKDAKGNPSRYGMQIFGSKGVVDLVEGTMPKWSYLGDPAWSPLRSGKQWQSISSLGIDEEEPLKDPIYYSRHGLAIADLLKAIENKRNPLCNAKTARDVIEMIASVFESHRLQQSVTLPLETRQNPLRLL